MKVDELAGRIGQREIGADAKRVDTIGDLFRQVVFDQVVKAAARGDAAKEQVPAGEGFPDMFTQKAFLARAGKAGGNDDRIKDTKENADRQPVNCRQRKWDVQKDDHGPDASRGVEHGEERGHKKLLKDYTEQQ